MTTTAGTQQDVGDLLNTLLELTHDVCVAFEAAIDRTEHESWLKEFHRILEDHEHQMRALRPYAERLSQNMSDSADVKALLNHGAVRLASLIGDGPLISALCRIQADMVTGYTRACTHTNLPAALQGLFKRHLEQAEGHLGWLTRERDSEKDSDFAAERAARQDYVIRGRVPPQEAADVRPEQSTDY